MAFVTRVELEDLQVRLQKCEQLLRLQGAQIKVLQAQRDLAQSDGAPGGANGGNRGFGDRGSAGAGFGDRAGSGAWWDSPGGGAGGRPAGPGRSPAWVPQPPPAAPAVPPSAELLASVEEFAAMSGLDEKCTAILRIQPPEVQQWVISQGPPAGTNPSAMVMSRIKKHTERAVVNVPEAADEYGAGASSRPQPATIEEFIAVNELDEKCISVLTIQPPEVQQFVISQGPASGSNPSATVMARIKRHGERALANVPDRGELDTPSWSSGARARSRTPPPHQEWGLHATMALEEFAAANQLDSQCLAVLRLQPPEVQQYVIGLGPAGGSNPSAMVMARIKKHEARALIPPGGASGSGFGGVAEAGIGLM